jgi:ribosomal protein S18 acetylase RimI-like enzyme
MQTEILPWDQLDLDELARLTCEAREAGRGTAETAVPRTLEWLRERFAGLSRFAVLARSGGQLLGWCMLVAQNPAKVEVNPWQLGGHPLVAPGQDRDDVGARLLQGATEWARGEGFETLELCAARDLADTTAYEAQTSWYASLGFGVREDSVGFLWPVSSAEIARIVAPEGLDLWPVMEVDQDALYRCYYDALSAGQSRFFFAQSETERRAYFDTFGKTYGLHEDTSMALVQAGKIVGFAYTIPFDRHLHLDWIGIHPSVRRRGLGRFLLSLIMERAADEGFQTMGLSCDAGNSRAIALYRSLGWRLEDAETKYAVKL